LPELLEKILIVEIDYGHTGSGFDVQLVDACARVVDRVRPFLRCVAEFESGNSSRVLDLEPASPRIGARDRCQGNDKPRLAAEDEVIGFE
jgi:hypothetical protein